MAKRVSEDQRSNGEFDNLDTSGNKKSKMENIPTPRRLKKKKLEENKSVESSSKVSAIPAVHYDNKDALKNILNQPLKSNLGKKQNKNADQQVGLNIPVESKPKKGKSFSKKNEKLQMKKNKSKTDEAKHKLRKNHR